VNRLTGVEELLDGPLDDPTELAVNLRDLGRLNRLSGAVRLSERAVAALSGAGAAATPASDRPATILDVGTGGADIPIALLARAAHAGRGLAVTATDSRVEVLAAARAVRPAIDRVTGLTLELADGRGLPYADNAFDIAHASLVLHHLEPVDAVAFLREMRRVARNGIVVNDLVRGRLAWVGTWLAVHAFATGRYARHDGPLSVRRAYSRPELVGLLDAAGLGPVATIVGFAGHRVAIAAR
jgi:SAM-dependent methyltransferase